MATEKLYDSDAYLREFTACVRSCEADADGWAVVLDRTAFYPEGGGQPCDFGTLGAAQVTDVRERGGEIVHRCSAPLPVGTEVRGSIDFARRFDHMQQHSGEHICSGLICARFGCDNVGFHMGADVVTIDFNADISPEALAEIEERANRYIQEDHPVEIRVFSGAVPDEIVYRSKKALTGDVRIVSFPGADCCACCGTHVARSGGVGIVKFLSCQKFRDGVRLELVCGGRAYRCLADAWEQNRRTAQLLSARPTESAAAVERLCAELSAARERIARLETRAFAALAEENAGRGDVLLFTEETSAVGVQKLCDAVAQRCGGRCAVFSGTDGAWKYAVAEPDGDLRALTRELNAALNGRGGGKPFFVQGSVNASRAEIEAFFRTR